jgi:hypothetical protein
MVHLMEVAFKVIAELIPSVVNVNLAYNFVFNAKLQSAEFFSYHKQSAAVLMDTMNTPTVVVSPVLLLV